MTVTCAVLRGHSAVSGDDDGANAPGYDRSSADPALPPAASADDRYFDVPLELEEDEDDDDNDIDDETGECAWPACRSTREMKLAHAFYRSALTLGVERHFFRLVDTDAAGTPAAAGPLTAAHLATERRAAVVARRSSSAGRGSKGSAARGKGSDAGAAARISAPQVLVYGPGGTFTNFTTSVRGSLRDNVLEFKHNTLATARGKLALVAFLNLGGGDAGAHDRRGDSLQAEGGSDLAAKVDRYASSEHEWRVALAASVRANREAPTAALVANGAMLPHLLRRMGWDGTLPAVACVETVEGGHFWMREGLPLLQSAMVPDHDALRRFHRDAALADETAAALADDDVAALADETAALADDTAAAAAPSVPAAFAERDVFADRSWHHDSHHPAARPAHPRDVPYRIAGRIAPPSTAALAVAAAAAAAAATTTTTTTTTTSAVTADQRGSAPAVRGRTPAMAMMHAPRIFARIHSARRAGRAVVLLAHTAHCMHCQLMLSVFTVVAERHCRVSPVSIDGVGGSDGAGRVGGGFPHTPSIEFVALDALSHRRTAHLLGISEVPEVLVFPPTGPSPPPGPRGQDDSRPPRGEVRYTGAYAVRDFAAWIAATVPSACHAEVEGGEAVARASSTATARAAAAAAAARTGAAPVQSPSSTTTSPWSLTPDQIAALASEVFGVDGSMDTNAQGLGSALAAIRDALELLPDALVDKE
jgi:hypothetical protein